MLMCLRQHLDCSTFNGRILLLHLLMSPFNGSDISFQISLEARGASGHFGAPRGFDHVG